MVLNKKFLNFGFLQIIIFQYHTFKLFVFKHFNLLSDFKNYCIHETDVNTRSFSIQYRRIPRTYFF
jgi:hypothetical protein